MTKGIELLNQEKIRKLGEKENWIYWKHTRAKSGYIRKKKSISGEQGN